MAFLPTWMLRSFTLLVLCELSASFSIPTLVATKGRFVIASQNNGHIHATSTALSMSLTLYGHPGTRSPLVNWACHELGVDFTMGDLSANPHPFGQIPCLTDDDDKVVLFESGAILQYLNYYHSSLTKQQTAAITSWITWANASLDPICFLETPEGKVYDTGLKKANKRMDRLNAILSQQEWLVESAGFTLADVAVASYLLYVIQFFPDTKLQWPAVVRFMKRAAARDAYQQAFGADMQAMLLDRLSKQDLTDSKKIFGMF